MSEINLQHPPDERAKKSARHINWDRIGAIAGVFGALAAIIALWPVASNAIHRTDNHTLFEGPIAQTAINERGYNEAGFSMHDLTTMADIVTYQFAGHYVDKAEGDHNPDNKMCSLTLHANPPSSYPYGGASGFVYIQAGTSYHPESEILHNPTVDDIYRKKLDFREHVYPECWPGNMTYPATIEGQ